MRRRSDGKEVAGYVIEPSRDGTNFVVTDTWTDTTRHASLASVPDQSALTLNYARGFRERSLDFLVGLPVRRLAVLSRPPTAGQDNALASVEVERRLELEARRGLGQAVAEARAAGHSWEQIVKHVPGLGPVSDADAAEKLFDLVSVPRSQFGQDHVTWRCGECEGLVIDRGPEAGHAANAEPGHRAYCERLAAEVSRYLAGLDADDELAVGVAHAATDLVGGIEAWDRPVEVDGPGLELW